MKRWIPFILILLLLLGGCTDSEIFSMEVDPETGRVTCVKE